MASRRRRQERTEFEGVRNFRVSSNCLEVEKSTNTTVPLARKAKLKQSASCMMHWKLDQRTILSHAPNE
jgi:hypothetical protein